MKQTFRKGLIKKQGSKSPKRRARIIWFGFRPDLIREAQLENTQNIIRSTVMDICGECFEVETMEEIR